MTIEHKVNECMYFPFKANLTPDEIAGFVCKVQASEEYEFGEYGHILIKDTDLAVGYVGDDRIDLVDFHKSLLAIHHDNLMALFHTSLS